MATAFVQRKQENLFNLYDADRDGTIDLSDLQQQASKLAQYFGHAPSSPQVTALHNEYAQLWQVLTAEVDTDRDGRIDRDQFFTALASKASTEQLFNQVFRRANQAEFAIADTDNDGVLSIAEVGRVLEAAGVPANHAQVAVKHLDRDASGQITREAWLAAFREYVLSEDPNAGGSQLFGKVQ